MDSGRIDRNRGSIEDTLKKLKEETNNIKPEAQGKYNIDGLTPEQQKEVDTIVSRYAKLIAMTQDPAMKRKLEEQMRSEINAYLQSIGKEPYTPPQGPLTPDEQLLADLKAAMTAAGNNRNIGLMLFLAQAYGAKKREVEIDKIQEKIEKFQADLDAVNQKNVEIQNAAQEAQNWMAENDETNLNDNPDLASIKDIMTIKVDVIEEKKVKYEGSDGIYRYDTWYYYKGERIYPGTPEYQKAKQESLKNQANPEKSDIQKLAEKYGYDEGTFRDTLTDKKGEYKSATNMLNNIAKRIDQEIQRATTEAQKLQQQLTSFNDVFSSVMKSLVETLKGIYRNT